MASKKPGHNKVELQAKRRMRIMQIIFAVFSFMLILSMILAAFITQ
jgi:hypothetical protein